MTSRPIERLSNRSKRRLMACMTLGSIVLLALAAEGLVRLRQHVKYGSAARFEDHYTVDAKLKLRVPVANFSSGRISINSLGFRGPEIVMPKPARTVRLAFLGASTTWCAEVSGNDQVWPHLVTSALTRAFPQVDFDYVNAAVPGYTMGSLLSSIASRVVPVQPDVVVVYEAANNLSAELRWLAVQRGLIAAPQLQEVSWPGQYSQLWYLAEKNLKVAMATREALANHGRLDVDSHTLGSEYRHGLKQVLLAARSHARLIAVATFAIHPRREQTPAVQMRASTSALVYTPFVTPLTLIESYERYNDIVREVARETGVLLIEGENNIPGDSEHFADTVHFTDTGSRAMAERVVRVLASSGVLREIIDDKAQPPATPRS